MSKLTSCLDQLFVFLHDWGLDPPVQEVRIVEMGRPIVMDDKHRVIISREAITTPEEYTARFEELTHSGLAWVNMSCYGVYDGYVLVVIELPEKALEANSPVVTSVNYSGPVHGVSQNGWDVSRVLAIL